MINATDCSDEEILKYIQETRGEDELHWSWKWIVFRTLKILVRDYLERRPGTLTDQEKKDLHDISASTG